MGSWNDWVGAAPLFALVTLRALGLVWVCPIFGSEMLPANVRFALAVVLALVLFPAVAAAPPITSALGWGVAAVREGCIGMGLGLLARLLFDALEGAARLVAGQSGFALAEMVDPLTGAPSVTPALFETLLGAAVFLAGDFHHLFFWALARSYEILPAGAPLLAGAGVMEVVQRAGASMFAIAATLAAPALAVTFAVDLALVLMGRALPQVPVLLVGYPLKMAAGLVGLALLAQGTGLAISWIGREFASDALALAAAVAGR